MDSKAPTLPCVTGESGTLADEPCVPIGQADPGRVEWGRAILAVSLLHQLDEPTGGGWNRPQSNVD